MHHCRADLLIRSSLRLFNVFQNADYCFQSCVGTQFFLEKGVTRENCRYDKAPAMARLIKQRPAWHHLLLFDTFLFLSAISEPLGVIWRMSRMLFYSPQSRETPAFLSVFIQLVFVQVARCRPHSHRAKSSETKAWRKNTTTKQGNITWVVLVGEGGTATSLQVWFIAGIFSGSQSGCCCWNSACTSELRQSFQLNALRLLCSSAILSLFACWGVTVCPFHVGESWPIVG